MSFFLERIFHLKILKQKEESWIIDGNDAKIKISQISAKSLSSPSPVKLVTW